jgi:hypothetical protein
MIRDLQYNVWELKEKSRLVKSDQNVNKLIFAENSSLVVLRKSVDIQYV